MASSWNKNKIAILIKKFHSIGGVEKYARYLADAFFKKGVEVTVLTTGTSLKPYPFQIVSFDLSSKFSFLQLQEFDKHCLAWLQKHPMDLVFGMDRNSFQTHYQAGNGVHAAYLDQRKKVSSWWKRLSFHWNPLHKTILQLEKRTYENPATRHIFTNSQMVKQEILKYYSTPPEKITVVHNGVQWEELQEPFDKSLQDKENLLKKWNLPLDRCHLLFIGNEYERKGLPFLLKALQKVPPKKFHLSVVGKEKKQAYYEKLAKRLGISSQISFFGIQNEVIPFYQMADCVVIPSIYDPFANITVEALAMGCFVVSSNQNGGAEILTKETGSVLNPIDDANAFANVLLTIPTKTKANSLKIRNSIQYLNLENQLSKIVDLTLC